MHYLFIINYLSLDGCEIRILLSLFLFVKFLVAPTNYLKVINFVFLNLIIIFFVWNLPVFIPVISKYFEQYFYHGLSSIHY